MATSEMVQLKDDQSYGCFTLTCATHMSNTLYEMVLVRKGPKIHQASIYILFPAVIIHQPSQNSEKYSPRTMRRSLNEKGVYIQIERMRKERNCEKSIKNFLQKGHSHANSLGI